MKIEFNLLDEKEVAKVKEILGMSKAIETPKPVVQAPVNPAPTPPVAPTPEPVVQTPVTPEPVAPPVEPAPVADPNCPITDANTLVKYVMESFQALGAEKGAGIQAILAEYGYTHMNQVTPENYVGFYQKVEALKV